MERYLVNKWTGYKGIVITFLAYSNIEIEEDVQV